MVVVVLVVIVPSTDLREIANSSKSTSLSPTLGKGNEKPVSLVNPSCCCSSSSSSSSSNKGTNGLSPSKSMQLKRKLALSSRGILLVNMRAMMISIASTNLLLVADWG